MDPITDFFRQVTDAVNRELDWLIPETGPGPKGLRDAIRWSLFAGGKRFRPALVVASGRTFGARDETLLRTAAATELIHTYSLIHDDLPSMDDDDLRRGRATCHKKFGESTAILAGDALQALAFQAIAEDRTITETVRVRLLSRLGRAAARMVSGQFLDLQSEGRAVSLEETRTIHINKTGALIEFAVMAGAEIAGVYGPLRDAAEKYGAVLGLLFQITDDLLDVTQPTSVLGKTAGKDIENHKATYPNAVGIAETQRLAEKVFAETVAAAESLGEGGQLFVGIARFLLERRN